MHGKKGSVGLSDLRRYHRYFCGCIRPFRREKAFSVRTAQAKTQDIYNSVTVFGSVVPLAHGIARPRKQQRRDRGFRARGDTVEKGQPLCTLKAAEAPPLSAADVQAAVSAVQADPDETETVSGSAVTSPFSGTVLGVPRAGETVRGGFPCAVIADLSSLRVRAETPELYADELRAGQKANITLASADRMYAARVASLAPVAVQAVSLAGDSGSVTVETMLDLEGRHDRSASGKQRNGENFHRPSKKCGRRTV